MADDSNARYRSNDPTQYGSDQAGPASDPLAELARLIGRSDPFGEYAARQSQPPPAPEPPPAPQPYRPEVPRYPSDDPIPRFLSEQPPRMSAEPAPRYSDSGAGDTAWSSLPPQHQPHHPQFDPFDLPPPPQAAPSPNAGPRIDPRLLADLQAKLGLGGAPAVHAHSQPAQASADPALGEPPPLYPHDPVPPPPALQDEYFDDAPPRDGRRKGMLTVAAVLGLAVIGTAGAFGYRSMFGGPSGPAPVIRASGEPSKVAPPPAKADQSASKFSYDRFGDRGQNEQVVAREERPLDAQELARSAAPPRSVFPPPPAQPQQQQFPVQAQPQAPSAQAQQAQAPSALGEPKRVRTVQIRPDQPEPAMTPQSVGANAPMQLGPPSAPPPSARASAPPPQQQQRVAARPQQVQPPPAPPPSANAPLSLAPETGGAVASVPPPRAAAPRTTASAPTGGGGYLVQVSSQRSEADAQAAYRGLQSRHGGVLNGQPHTIRRADLGERGVYYRAMVGPFGTREQAIQLCSSLKASGGDCVVQSN